MKGEIKLCTKELITRFKHGNIIYFYGKYSYLYFFHKHILTFETFNGKIIRSIEDLLYLNIYFRV